MTEALFWMDGYRASGAAEIHNSLLPLAQDLDPDDFWAVIGSYEGEWQVIRFSDIQESERLDSRPTSHLDGKGTWSSSLKRDEYLEYVNAVREEIRRGWVYQVNACRLLESSDGIDLRSLFYRIQESHPAPVAAYFKSNQWEVASASPETFLRIDCVEGNRFITTSPIKGTSRDRAFKEKDRAENVMIVDLMRNDISPLCVSGSVDVPRLLGVEEHPGLFHLVSDVKGRLNEQATFADILNRLSPAGSITGAPKSSAREVISRYEPYRGIYCGTLGWIFGGRARFSVAIRTFFRDLTRFPEKVFFGTGAGITWGSNPQEEWNETELKADRLMKIASGTL